MANQELTLLKLIKLWIFSDNLKTICWWIYSKMITKWRNFLEKSQNSPRLPFASGGRGLRSQIPVFDTHPCRKHIFFSKFFEALLPFKIPAYATGRHLPSNYRWMGLGALNFLRLVKKQNLSFLHQGLYLFEKCHQEWCLWYKHVSNWAWEICSCNISVSFKN